MNEKLSMDRTQFTLTDAAVKRIQTMQEAGDLPKDGGLRVSVKSGGCSGLSYSIEWSLVSSEGDHTFQKDGVNVYVDRKSMLFLGGSELTFEGTLMSSMFKIVNPNAKSTCGCGESFSV